MERKKWRCRRGRTFKRDTPVKSSLGRRQKPRRLPASKFCEAIPEELETDENIVHTVRPNSPVRKNVWPIHCDPVLSLNSPARTEKSRNPAFSPDAPTTKESAYQGSPAGSFTIQTPNSNALSCADQNLTETTENAGSSSMESDTVFCSDANWDDCYYSSSFSSRSLPSPEIFRGEEFVKTVTSSIEEVGLHPISKNSTLQDVSWAQNIHLYQPPNLSPITDQASEHKPPAELIMKRTILCKKKVLFQNPKVSKVVEMKASGSPVLPSSQTGQMKHYPETFKVGEVHSNNATLHLRATQGSPEKAVFFDFNENEEDEFFQMMRQRALKLRNSLFSQLTAVKITVSPGL